MSELSFEPLTPTRHLDRAARVHGDRVAVVDGDRRWTYAELHDRCTRLAGALRSLGVQPGDRVAVLAPNTHVMLEAHYGVPWAGAVLVCLNVRLAAGELAHILRHSGATVLLCDAGLVALAEASVADLDEPPRLVVAGADYEQQVASAAGGQHRVDDERALLALNYTSGTTGTPKGVMYHHRGAYLQSLAMALHSRLDVGDAYLWTLPMFHCNGWCFTWAVTAAGAAHVCLPKVDPAQIWELVRTEGISHLCAAPTVLTGLVDHADARRTERPVWVATGGAPPSPTLLEQTAALGLDVTHLYGLTETFGPAVICDWRPEWNALGSAEQAALRARQGVANVISEPVRVIDGGGDDVPADGATLGEVALRGNNVMTGYYRDPDATAAAAPDGWFRTGDLGVVHPDGYLELRDRAKDVIISGGENISSVEVEAAIVSHPAVLEAAVFAAPDPRWGERPAARVTLKTGACVAPEEIRAHVRTILPGFKVPDTVSIGPLPKTATGKIQKYQLRREAWAGHDRRIG